MLSVILPRTTFTYWIDEFRQKKSLTAHDNDLGLMLNVLVEMKMFPQAKIIGIPIGSNPSDVVPEVQRLLSDKPE